MSETKSPDSKRQRRSLSISKHKKNEAKAAKSKPQSSRSIISFFNSTPPAKLACPACGEMVPRFGINKHMDEMCHKLQKDCNDDVILVDTVTTSVEEESPSTVSLKTKTSGLSPATMQNLEVSRSPTRNSPTQMSEPAAKQTSPYFKKNKEIHRLSGEHRAPTVKIIPLGSLSSKLSRKYHKQERESSVQCEATYNSAQTIKNGYDGFTEQTDDILHLNSSQKENQFVDISKGNTQPISKQRITVGTYCEGTVESNVSLLETKCTLPSLDRDVHTPAKSMPSEMKYCSVNEQSVDKTTTQESENNCKIVSCDDEKLQNFNCLDEICETPKTSRASSSTEHVCTDRVQNVPTEGNSKVLPMEEKSNELGNDAICKDFLEPFEEAVLQSPSTLISLTTSQDDTTATSVRETPRQPYYLRNFLMVLQTVMENEDDRRLFSEADLTSIKTFQQLSDAGQKLYVRLFQRKLNWIKVNKLEYAEIGSDLVPIIEELVKMHFLQTESELEDISEALDLLSAPELKTLAKALHLANPSAQKHQLLEGFLRLAKQRPVFSFSKKQPSTGAVILKRAKELAGPCVRVCKGPRAVFSRVLLLFSLTDSMEEEDAAYGGQNQLFTVLMVNMGRLAFPDYTVNRKTKIFQDREDLVRYETAMHMLNDITTTMVNGHWEEAYQLYKTAKECWQDLKNSTSLRYHEELPVYLRCYTVGWVYTRILSRGIEILQRLRMYEEAVEELHNLLSQHIYCSDSRGRWWDRLALNLHQHLKQTLKVINCIKEGLSDPTVRTGHQFSLYQRALRMKDSPSCKKFRSLLQDLPEITVKDVTHVTIKGKLFPHMGMGKSVFLMQDTGAEESGEESASSTVMCSVEELALAHYRQQGFDQGIHGEGSTFSTLFGLLMWEVIFMDGIADVFRNPYQAFPLDLYTDGFYENRRDAIEGRLQLLRDAACETLQQLVADVWNTQEGKAAALINWERFSSLQQAQSLVSCLGGPFLSGVCGRLAKDLRHCRGGLPDLVVWSSQNNSYKLVEVKGPNDRLSYKQMIWLHELSKLDAIVEVCHVTAIGARSTRLS